MMEDGTVVKVRIKESVPSGVVTFLEGIRAFIPASQLALDYVENTEEWIGKEVEAKVITVDPERKNWYYLQSRWQRRQQSRNVTTRFP